MANYFVLTCKSFVALAEQDPDHPDYKFYDLTRDAEVLLRGTDVSSKIVFSQVAHYPPKIETKKAL
jgi:hypothetical protein